MWRVVYVQLAPRISFDVASIRPHEEPLPRGADFSISGSRITYGCYNPWSLILEAYNLKPYQASAASSKIPLYDDYYEIAPVAPGDAVVTRDQSRLMLQTLLADRFKLQLHREMRDIPAYERVADKNGPLLKPGSGHDACASLIGPVQLQDRNYRYQFTNCPQARSTTHRWAKVEAENETAPFEPRSARLGLGSVWIG